MLLRKSGRPTLVREWAGEVVLFDRYSGETHHLNPLASAIFRRLLPDTPVELGVLCTDLADASDIDKSSATPDLIGTAAAGLRFAGLIEVIDTEA